MLPFTVALDRRPFRRGLKIIQIDHTGQNTGKIDLNQRGQYSLGQGIVRIGRARTQARVILGSYPVAGWSARPRAVVGRSGSPRYPRAGDLN